MVCWLNWTLLALHLFLHYVSFALHLVCLVLSPFCAIFMFVHQVVPMKGSTHVFFFFFFDKLHLNSQCTTLVFGTVSPCYPPQLVQLSLLLHTIKFYQWPNVMVDVLMLRARIARVGYFNSTQTTLYPTFHPWANISKSTPALDPLIKTFTKGLPSFSFCRLLQWLHNFLWILLSC